MAAHPDPFIAVSRNTSRPPMAPALPVDAFQASQAWSVYLATGLQYAARAAAAQGDALWLSGACSVGHPIHRVPGLLHAALSQGHSLAARVILASRADPNEVCSGWTPVACAMERLDFLGRPRRLMVDMLAHLSTARADFNRVMDGLSLIHI